MPFLHTTELLETLKTRLESLRVDPANPESEKLFQRVGYFGASKLNDALKATFAAEQRVCFIVPAGDNHTNIRNRSFTWATRGTKIVLLIADRALEKVNQEALVGGPKTLGVLELKDLVIDDLFANAFADVPDLAFEPGDGDVLIIGNEKNPADLGRECYMQHFTAYAGQAQRAIN
jgi:hypothetical protein